MNCDNYCDNCERFNYNRGYQNAERRYNKIINSLKLILQSKNDIDLKEIKSIIGDILKQRCYDHTNRNQTDALCDLFDICEVVERIKKELDIC